MPKNRSKLAFACLILGIGGAVITVLTDRVASHTAVEPPPPPIVAPRGSELCSGAEVPEPTQADLQLVESVKSAMGCVKKP